MSLKLQPSSHDIAPQIALRRGRAWRRCWPASRATRSTPQRALHARTCSGCSTTGSCGSRPTTADDPDRDRFLLSKGHGPAAYYAVLAAKGFIPEAWLDGLGGLGQSARVTTRTGCGCPGVEISSGSLGHGLPLGVGVALGLRAQGCSTRGCYVLLGDAELDEGSNHEAIAYAGATGLDALTAIVIDNESATHGWPGGIASRFTVNGWTAVDRRRPGPRRDRGRPARTRARPAARRRRHVDRDERMTDHA